MKNIFLFGLLLCIGTCLVFSQDATYSVVFSKAKQLYNAGKYDSTIVYIKEYLKDHGKEETTETIVPILMESLVRQQEYSDFKKVLRIFQKKFPGSKFIPRLLYLNGVVLAKEEEYKKSILSFSSALHLGLSAELDTLSIKNVSAICENKIGESDLCRLSENEDLQPHIAEIVTYYAVKRTYDAQETGKARKLAEQFLAKFPDSFYAPQVGKIANVPPPVSSVKSFFRGAVQIALLAPLTGENAEIGKLTAQASQLAIEEYNKTGSPRVELVTVDTKANMVETAKKVKDLTENRRISILLGPMLSPEATVAAAAVMNNSRVVMVTPTATDDGIAGLGKNIFQVNVSAGILGKRIARYAVENLNIRECVIFSPNTEYGKTVSNGFKEEVIRLGGSVVAEESFEEGTNDYKTQFENIRKTLAQKKWDLAAESGVTCSKKEKESFLADSVIEVGGFFIPAEAEDAVKVCSQVYFHMIRTQLLGSNGWHSNSILLDGKKYVENAIISTDFEADQSSEAWISFSTAYKKRFGEVPDKIVAPLSYDAAALVLQGLQKGTEGEQIAEYLRTVKGYPGISGTISFDKEGGANTESAIVKISNKKFIKIQ